MPDGVTDSHSSLASLRCVNYSSHFPRTATCHADVGNEPNSTGERNESVDGSDCPNLRVKSVLAHDIYSTLRDRDGHLCCGGQDCKPVEAVGLPDGDYYLPATDEVIPADMATPSPYDRFHRCSYYPMANEFDPWGRPVWEPKTRCFFAPGMPQILLK